MIILATANNARSSTQYGRNKIWLRIGGLLIFVIGLVLILISFLNYSNYRKAYLELNLTRYLIAAKDLRQTVVTGLNVGLSPAENVHLYPAMKDMAQLENGIRFIGIMDEFGEIISIGKIPEYVVDDSHARLLHTQSDMHWQTSDANTFQIGIPFFNNFNIKAGAVVIGYDRGTIESASHDMLHKLCVDVLVTLLLLTTLTLSGVYLLTHQFSRELISISDAIDASARDEVRQEIRGSFLDESVARDIANFTVLTRHISSEIAHFESLSGGGKNVAESRT